MVRPHPAAGQVFKALEHRFDARVGIYLHDTGTGRTVAYHADRRFAYASTYKALAVGVLLTRLPDGDLDDTITYTPEDLQAWSPVTSEHVRTGMTLRAVMAAAIRRSDNTAANLLLQQLGGPHALQRELRRIGDKTTRVDRKEPAVNSAIPGDLRDTSTPRAMASDLQTLALGNLLPPDRRKLFIGWLRRNTTGGPYIRAGVPDGWTVGDKTGNGGYGTRNDIAILWPPHDDPIVIAILTRRDTQDAASDDALIAEATRAALKALHHPE